MGRKKKKGNESRYTNYNDLCLRVAVWEEYNRKDVYFGEYIPFRYLQIDHIIPQALYTKGREQEKKEYLEQFDLDENFQMDDLLNYLPSSGTSNRLKGADLSPAVTAWGLKKAKNNKEKIKKRIDQYYDSFSNCSNAVALRGKILSCSNPKKELYDTIDILLDDVTPFEVLSESINSCYQESTESIYFTGHLPTIQYPFDISCSIQFRTLHIRNAVINLDLELIYSYLLQDYKKSIEPQFRRYIIFSKKIDGSTKNDEYFLSFPSISLKVDKTDVDDLCRIFDTYCEKLVSAITAIVKTYGIKEFRLLKDKVLLLSINREIREKLHAFIRSHDNYKGYDLSESNDMIIKISESGKYHGILYFIEEPNAGSLINRFYIYERLNYLNPDNVDSNFWSAEVLRNFLLKMIKESLIYDLEIGSLPNKKTISVDKEIEYIKQGSISDTLINYNSIFSVSQFRECIATIENYFTCHCNTHYYLKKNIYASLVYLYDKYDIPDNDKEYICSKLGFGFEDKNDLNSHLKSEYYRWRPNMCSSKKIGCILKCVITIADHSNLIGISDIKYVLQYLHEEIEIYNREILIKNYLGK